MPNDINLAHMNTIMYLAFGLGLYSYLSYYVPSPQGHMIDEYFLFNCLSLPIHASNAF